MRPTHVCYLIVAALAVGQAGCLAVAAGAAGGAALGYAYWQGKDCQTYPASLDHAWAATKSALVDLAMPVLEEHRENEGGYIECETANHEKVRIYLEVEGSKIPADGPQTKVSVRVALFGDHPVSGRILEQVGAHLVPGVPGTHPPPTPPAWSSSSALAPPANPGRPVTTEPPLAAPDAAPPPRSVRSSQP